MSPEQAKGRPADKRSDVWAVGCVVYEMLTGKRAFPGDDVMETLSAVKARTRKIRISISGWFEELQAKVRPAR